MDTRHSPTARRHRDPRPGDCDPPPAARHQHREPGPHPSPHRRIRPRSGAGIRATLLPHWAASPGTRRRDERGSTLAESVIVLGLLALLVFGIIQYAADEHAEQAAQAAAALALATARAQNGTAGQGQAAGQQLLASLTGAIHDTTVTVQRTATQVTVRVTGHVDTLLGFSQAITVTSSGPVERFTPNVNTLGLGGPSAPAARSTLAGNTR